MTRKPEYRMAQVNDYDIIDNCGTEPEEWLGRQLVEAGFDMRKPITRWSDGRGCTTFSQLIEEDDNAQAPDEETSPLPDV